MNKRIPICCTNNYEENNIDYKKPIDINFTRDYNINHIHSLVINKFKLKKKKIPKIEQKIQKINKKLKRRDIEKLEIVSYKIKIRDYNKKIDSIKEKKHKYIELTFELLELYNSDNTNKIEIINDYLEISSKYIKLITHKVEEINNYCLNCGYEITFLGDTDSIQHCYNCKFQLHNNGNIKAYTKMSSDDDKKRVNMGNFIRILCAFESSEGFELEKCYHKSLDEYFISQNNKDLTKIKSGKCKYNSLKMMKKALYEIKKSCFYKNIYSICNQYFGWPKNYIGDIKTTLLIFYERVQIWSKNNPTKERNSSLNNQWLLCEFCGILAPGRFSKNDFMIIRSDTSLIFHNERWQKMRKESSIFS